MGAEENRAAHYRSAVNKLSKAVAHYNTVAAELAFVVSLGDVIDGNLSKVRVEQAGRLHAHPARSTRTHLASLPTGLPAEKTLADASLPAGGDAGGLGASGGRV